MAITHTFAGSRHNGGYGYYAFIEDGELVIGENWPREGGETYRGTFANASRAMRTLEKEAVRLYNSITKYYTQHPEQTNCTSLKNLLPGTKFRRKADGNYLSYMLIDFDVAKCFVFGSKLQRFVAAIDLLSYKVYLFEKETEVELISET
jgi:hypothetical protein